MKAAEFFNVSPAGVVAGSETLNMAFRTMSLIATELNGYPAEPGYRIAGRTRVTCRWGG